MWEDTEMIVRPTREANITLMITMVSLQVAVSLVIKLYIFVKKARYLSTTLWGKVGPPSLHDVLVVYMCVYIIQSMFCVCTYYV